MKLCINETVLLLIAQATSIRPDSSGATKSVCSSMSMIKNIFELPTWAVEAKDEESATRLDPSDNATTAKLNTKNEKDIAVLEFFIMLRTFVEHYNDPALFYEYTHHNTIESCIKVFFEPLTTNASISDHPLEDCYFCMVKSPDFEKLFEDSPEFNEKMPKISNDLDRKKTIDRTRQMWFFCAIHRKIGSSHTSSSPLCLNFYSLNRFLLGILHMFSIVSREKRFNLAIHLIRKINTLNNAAEPKKREISSIELRQTKELIACIKSVFMAIDTDNYMNAIDGVFQSLSILLELITGYKGI